MSSATKCVVVGFGSPWNIQPAVEERRGLWCLGQTLFLRRRSRLLRCDSSPLSAAGPHCRRSVGRCGDGHARWCQSTRVVLGRAVRDLQAQGPLSFHTGYPWSHPVTSLSGLPGISPGTPSHDFQSGWPTSSSSHQGGILGPELTSSQTHAYMEAQPEEALLETGSLTSDVGYFTVC